MDESKPIKRVRFQGLRFTNYKLSFFIFSRFVVKIYRLPINIKRIH
jgi:hypothetical protein